MRPAAHYTACVGHPSYRFYRRLTWDTRFYPDFSAFTWTSRKIPQQTSTRGSGQREPGPLKTRRYFMKRQSWLVLPALLVVVIPSVLAGGDYKCTKSTQECLDAMT